MNLYKRYLMIGLLGMVLFVVGCLPSTTADVELPIVSEATPTLAAEVTPIAVEPDGGIGNGALPMLDQTYLNESYGFAINYPTGYAVEEAFMESDKAPNEFTVSIVEPVEAGAGGMLSMFSLAVEVKRNDQNLTAAEYGATMPFSPAGTTAWDVTTVKFNGVEGYQQIEDGLDGVASMPVIQMMTYYAQGDYLYTVRLLAPTQEKLDEYRPLYGQMLTTFMLTGAGQTADSGTVTTGEFVTPDDSQLNVTQEESPYGNGWVVKMAEGTERRVIGEDGTEYYYVRLSMSNPDAGQSWTVVEGWRPWGLGHDVPELFSWSGDGWSIYYTNVPRVDGCAVFVNGWDLHQFNFETGETTTIVENGGFSLAMAGHEQAVSYGRGSTLSTLNRNDGMVTQVELNGTIGAMMWAPDMQSILVTVVENGCAPEMAYSFVRVDPYTSEVRSVLPPTNQQLTLEGWPVFDEVELRDQDGNLWLLNPNTGGLESAADVQTGLPPAGLIYQSDTDFVWVTVGGHETVFATGSQVAFSPDAARAVTYNYQNGEMAILEIASGEITPIAQDFYNVAQVDWLDNGRLLLGVMLGEDNMGPNNGFLTIYDIAQDEFVVLDDSQLMCSSPAADPNGAFIAYDQCGLAQVYDLGTGNVAAFDPTQFSGWSFGEDVRLGSPSYSPDGQKLAWIIGGPTVAFGSWGVAVGVFDLQAQTVTVVGEYQVVGRDGWPAAAAWSPDGQWVAVQEWAVDRSQEGLWLYRVDGSVRQHLGSQTAEGGWSPDGGQITFTRYEQDGGRDYFRFDVVSGEKVAFELPGFARPLMWFE